MSTGYKQVKVSFVVFNYDPDLNKKEFVESIKEDVGNFLDDEIISVMTEVDQFEVHEISKKKNLNKMI
jgi:hypothetical protein